MGTEEKPPKDRNKQPLKPAELADRLYPTHASISPDGRFTSCVVAPIGQVGEHRQSSIWRASNYDPAIQFTSGTGADTHPVWSPDSQHLAFLSDRALAGTRCLYLIASDGGEALQLGEINGDLSQPAWSPDGGSIGLLRRDEMPTAESDGAASGFDQVVANSTTLFNRLWLVDINAGGKATQLTFGNREIRSWDWSTDGGTLFAVSTTETGYDALDKPADIVAIPVTGGLARVVSSHVTCPHYLTVTDTPNGDLIAVRGDTLRMDPADSIWTVPASGGRLTNRLPEFNGSVDRTGPVPGQSSTILALITKGLHANGYFFDTESAALTPILSGHLQSHGSIESTPQAAHRAEHVALVWSDGDLPEELFVTSSTGTWHQLTSFGSSFVGRLQPVEEVSWQSDGHTIQGLLTLPAGFQNGNPTPLVLEVHGGPSSCWTDSCFLNWHDWAQMLASNGIAVLAPNPRGSTGRGSDFQRLLQDDVGGGEYRDLVAGAEAMVDLGFADPERLGIAGWSWGGYLTAFTITQTTLFRAAFMGAGLSNMISDHGQSDIPSANLRYYPGLPYAHWEQYWEASPLRHIRNISTPLLIAHGEEDTRVQIAQSVEMHSAMLALGKTVEFVRYPGEGHSFTRRAHQIDLMERITAWFQRWLLSS